MLDKGSIDTQNEPLVTDVVLVVQAVNPAVGAECRRCPLQKGTPQPPLVEGQGERPRRAAAVMHRSRGWDSSMAHEAFTVPGATQGVICPLATQMATAMNEPYSEDKSVDTRRVKRSTRCTPE